MTDTEKLEELDRKIRNLETLTHHSLEMPEHERQQALASLKAEREALQRTPSGAARPPEPAPLLAEKAAAVRSADPKSRLNYRSSLKNAILVYLMRHRTATTLQVCRGLDARGGVELPQSWRKNPGDRSFAYAYKVPSVRNDIKRLVSKVRTDMRKNELLPRR